MRGPAVRSTHEHLHRQRRSLRSDDLSPCGRSGLLLPAISLGLWHNFGDDRPIDTQRAILRRAFDRGVTHFDLANNYGPPYGSAEIQLRTHPARGLRRAARRTDHLDQGRLGHVARTLRRPRDRASTCSRASTRASKRLGVDYVDIFYHHHFDQTTPLEETLGALDSAVRQGKALYVGISSYSDERTREAIAILRELGTPLLDPPAVVFDAQSMDRGATPRRARRKRESAASPSPRSAQGLLTESYLEGSPRARAPPRTPRSLRSDVERGEPRARARASRSIAHERGQTLSQMALAWALRDPRVTSVLIGASSVAQLDENLDALNNLEFTDEELKRDRRSTRSRAASTSGVDRLRNDGYRAVTQREVSREALPSV